jgi:hypothetical protein
MNVSRQVLKMLSAFIVMLFAFQVFAGPGVTTYQAKIIKPDGYPLEANNVNFKFTILNPLGSCILYSETYSSINMTATGGVISFSLGSGIKTYPSSATTFADVFSNVTPNLSCDAGGPGSYSPGSSDIRKIVMQFHDGAGWQTLPAMSINAVPYAMYANDAQQLGGVSATAFVQRTEIQSCSGGQALFYNGTTFTCVTAGGGGGVTSSTITAALGYTPADGASITTVTSNVSNLSTYASNVSSTVFSVSSTVSSLANSVSTLTTAIGASFSAITSSQWVTSGTTISYNGGSIFVSGGVRIGTENSSCSTNLAGTLRYNSGIVEYCNGTSWAAFGVSGAGILAINGLASGSQTFATGATGTQPNISSSGTVHTFNFPLASAATTTAGVISNSDYSLFSTVVNKITSSATSIAQVLGYTPADAVSVTNLSSSVSAVSSSVSTLASTVVAVSASANSTSVQVAAVSAVANAAQANVATLSSTVNSVSATANSVQASVAAVSATVTSLSNSVAASFAAIAGSGISTLNGSTSATQSFTNGTTGTQPAYVTANGVHTLNIPYASVGTTTSGLISNSDYSLFSTVISKITSSAASIAQVLGYTPADAVSVTNLSSTVAAVSAAITSLSNNKITSSAASIAQVLGYVPAVSGAVASSQWTTSGTTINYLSGNVGIGTSNPTSLLHVTGNAASDERFMVKADGSVIAGRGSASGQFASSFGGLNAANGFNAFATGHFVNAIGNYSFGAGLFNNSTGDNSMTLGYSLTANSLSMVAVGANNLIPTGTSTTGWQPTDPIFVIGNGQTSSQVSASTAVTVLKNGNMGINTMNPVTKLEVSGGIRLSMESVTCAASYAGTIRYNAGSVELCNGTTWSAFGVAGAGITSVNGSTSGTQSFARGIAGTQPAFVTLNGIHTLNIPYAASSTVAAGLISNSDYAAFTNQGSSITTLSSNISTVSAAANTAQTTANAVSTTVATKITSSPASIAQVLGYTPAAVGGSVAFTCPAGFTKLTKNSQALGCIKNTTLSAVSCQSAITTCWNSYGARLPTYPEIRAAVAESIVTIAVPQWTGEAGFDGTDETCGMIYTDGSPDGTDEASSLAHRCFIPAGANGGSVALFSDTDLDTKIQVEESVNENKIRFDTSGTERMVIDNLGNVGIGIATATRKLHLQYTQSGADEGLMIENLGNAGAQASLKSSGAGGREYVLISTGSANSPGAGVLGFYDATAGGGATGYRMVLNASGSVGIGTVAPTAVLNIKAGTAALAPLKLTSGTLLTSPASGAVEYDGYNLYYTDGANTRRTIAANTANGTYDSVNTIANSSGNIAIYPNNGAGTVTVSATTASTDSQTGALVVKGGVGVSGNLFTSGTIVTNSNLGIGTNAPAYPLDVSATSAIRLPAGTTAQRPAATSGIIRFNTDTKYVEFNDGTSWTAVAQERVVQGANLLEMLTFNDGYQIRQYTNSGGAKSVYLPDGSTLPNGWNITIQNISTAGPVISQVNVTTQGTDTFNAITSATVFAMQGGVQGLTYKFIWQGPVKKWTSQFISGLINRQPPGRAINIYAGNATTGGGYFAGLYGSNGYEGTGGGVSLNAGAANSVSGSAYDGSLASVNGGGANLTGTGGAVNINGGYSSDGLGGAVYITGGSNFNSNNFGGNVYLVGGTGKVKGQVILNSSMRVPTAAASMGTYAIALNDYALASGTSSIALGAFSSAIGDYSTTMGISTAATGNFSTAMGNNSTASGTNSVAFGQGAVASADTAIAFGYNTLANGIYSTAFGSVTKANGLGSLAYGTDTIANGSYSAAAGQSTIADSYASFAIGKYNVGGGNATSWSAADPVFEIGIGSFGNTFNAMTVLKNGFTGLSVSHPVTMLEVAGGLKIGYESSGCSSTYVGTLRYNAGSVELCNGSSWAALGGGGGTSLGGRSVSSTAPSNGQVLTWNSVTASWEPSSAGGASQWTTSGTNIYNNNAGNVGIGIASAVLQAKLQVHGDSTYTGSGGGQISVRGASNHNQRLELGYNTSQNQGFIQSVMNGGSAQSLSLNPDGGLVGIGVSAPQVMAHILNSGPSNESLRVERSTATLPSFAQFRNGTGRLNIGVEGNVSGTSVTGSTQYAGFIDSNNRDLFLATGNTARITVKTSGDVGIGTSNPTTALDLYRTNVDTELAIRTAGTAYNPGFSFANGTTTFRQFMSAGGDIRMTNSGYQDFLKIASDGTQIFSAPANIPKMNFTSTGLGIGIGASIASSALQVAGNITFGAKGGTTDDQGSYVLTSNGQVGLYANQSGASDSSYVHLILGAGTATSHQGSAIVFQPLGAEKMRVDNNGLGIGTTAPSFPLDVQTSGSITTRLLHSSNNANDGAAILLSRTRGSLSSNLGVQAGDTIGGLYFRAHDGVDPYTTTASVEVNSAVSQTPSSRGNYMAFKTTTSGSATSSERMRIADSGFVGIGTTSPYAMLSVGPNSSGATPYLAYVGSYLSTGGQAQWSGNWASSGYWGIGPNTNTNDSTIRLGNMSANGTWNSTQGVNLNIGGFLKVGATGVASGAAARAVHIAHATAAEMVLEQTNSLTDYKRWNFVVDSGTASVPSRFYIRQLNDAGNGGAVIMTLTASGNMGVATQNPSEKLHVVGNIRAQGTVTDCTIGNGSGGTSCSSDARLKNNIKPIPYALDKINALRGVEFDWNEKSLSNGRHDIGVIAQDVEKVFPTAVMIDKSTGYRKVDYAVLVAPLIQAVKELYVKVTQLFEQTDKNTRAIASLEEKDSVKDQQIKALTLENERKDKEMREMKERLDRLEKALLKSK